MRKKKHFRVMAAILAGLMFTAGCGSDPMDDYEYESYEEDEEESSEGYLDSITPGMDFYGYVNGKELMAMDLGNKDITSGTATELSHRIKDQTEGILDEIIAGSDKNDPGSNEQMIHDLYYLAYNQFSGKIDVDEEDTEFVDGIIDRINSVSTKDEFLKLTHDLYVDYGFSTYIMFGVGINIYDSQENVLIGYFNTKFDLEDMKRSQFTAGGYRDQIADSLKVTGVSTEEAKQRATNVIYMMYDIASGTDFDVTNGEKSFDESFNVLSRSECEELLHNLSYEDLVYAGGFDGSAPDKIVLRDPGQVTAIDAATDDEHLDEWKDLTVHAFLQYCGEWLPKKYNLSGDQVTDPDKQARLIVRQLLSMQIGEEFAERYMTDEKREIVTKMCEDMRAEYRELIGGADWLSEEGRAYLLDKLNNMLFFVGAGEPHAVNAADADILDSSLLKTIINDNAAKVKKNLATIDETPVRDGFRDVNICEVNASYASSTNSITINLGILFDPFFDEKGDYATNLGTLGATLGHEMSHAFDSAGILYDADGNYRPDAMPEEDIKAFDEIQQKTIDYYDSFTVLGSHVNGKLTLAENLADISGLQCALAIAGTPEEQKKVFEGYALSWQTLIVDKQAKDQLDFDEHAPDIIRVNAVVSCFDEFYEIYDVKEGDAMYVAPEERIRRW